MVEAVRGNVFAMVAGMASRQNSNAEKRALASDINKEVLEKAIAQTLQDIENSASNRLNGINAIKDFLERLATQDLGPDVNAYVQAELESVDTYKNKGRENDYAQFLSTRNKEVTSEVDQKLSIHETLMKGISQIDDTIGAMVKLFHKA